MSFFLDGVYTYLSSPLSLGSSLHLDRESCRAAQELFAKYDVDNNGQLSFYEFACRAVPPDYQSNGKLYSLTGGGGTPRIRVNGYRPSLEENIQVHKDDINLYCKERNLLDTPAIEIPAKYFRPRSTASTARSRRNISSSSKRVAHRFQQQQQNNNKNGHY